MKRLRLSSDSTSTFESPPKAGQPHQLAQGIGVSGELWQLQAALGELYLTDGNEQQARRMYTQATSVIQGLADRIHDEQVRIRFLSSLQIQSVFERF